MNWQPSHWATNAKSGSYFGWGDTYDELVAKLDKLAGVGLAVVIVRPSERQKLDPRRN